MSLNTNMIHNILNLIGLIIGALLTFDWTMLGFSAEQAVLFAGYILLADKTIKLLMNFLRDGLMGLFLRQPPVVMRR
ncbi:MAG: hypothetical protein ACRCYS_13265 [Beijerinckiaceae bacterium]